FFACYVALHVFPSFPTRRSSDLGERDTRQSFFCDRLRVLHRRSPAQSAQRRSARERQEVARVPSEGLHDLPAGGPSSPEDIPGEDRKSTRLNSSHEWRSYAVFCL